MVESFMMLNRDTFGLKSVRSCRGLQDMVAIVSSI
jgi:hypothetical protein